MRFQVDSLLNRLATYIGRLTGARPCRPVGGWETLEALEPRLLLSAAVTVAAEPGPPSFDPETVVIPHWVTDPVQREHARELLRQTTTTGSGTPAYFSYTTTGSDVPMYLNYTTTGSDAPMYLNYTTTGSQVPISPNYTTTGSHVPIYPNDDPGGQGDVQIELTESGSLIGMDTFRADPLFAGINGSGLERIGMGLLPALRPHASWAPSISADGRYISFTSSASDLVPNDTNGCMDVFVYDRQMGTIERVSVASDGTQGDGTSHHSSISADGRYVAFDSYADNLVPGDTNGQQEPSSATGCDVFVYDRQTGMLERVSVASDGAQGDGESGSPAISADGRYVAFESISSNLVSGDTNASSDVFVYDRQTGAIERVSVASDGAQLETWSRDPSISADGRVVAFASARQGRCHGSSGVWRAEQDGVLNLVVDDLPPIAIISSDILIYDRQTGTLENITAEASGSSADPKLSANGRFVAFTTSGLVPENTNGQWDVFVYDRQERTYELVSVASDGTQGNNSSFLPSISADGRYVAFASTASNLIDTAAAPDVEHNVFVYDRQTDTIAQLSLAPDDTPGDGWSWSPCISPDGQWVSFDSDARNLVAGDTNNATDVFVAPNPSAEPLPPTIDSLTASPDPVILGQDLTLTTHGVAAPEADVSSVEFYRESNGIPGLQIGAAGDTYLGADSDGTDGWAWTGSTASFPAGANIFHARAQDGGSVSAAATATIAISAGVPLYGDFSATGAGELWGSASSAAEVNSPDLGDLNLTFVALNETGLGSGGGLVWRYVGLGRMQGMNALWQLDAEEQESDPEIHLFTFDEVPGVLWV